MPLIKVTAGIHTAPDIEPASLNIVDFTAGSGTRHASSRRTSYEQAVSPEKPVFGIVELPEVAGIAISADPFSDDEGDAIIDEPPMTPLSPLPSAGEDAEDELPAPPEVEEMIAFPGGVAVSGDIARLAPIITAHSKWINHKNEGGWAAIHLCAYADRLDGVKLLIEHGVGTCFHGQTAVPQPLSFFALFLVATLLRSAHAALF